MNKKRLPTDLKFSEISKVFDNIKAKEICENFQSLHHDATNAEILQLSKKFDFDQIGLLDDKTQRVVKIVKIEDSSIIIKELISLSILISEAAALSKVAFLLKSQPFLLVLREDGTLGILTKFDFQKIPARLYIFGLISLTEIHLTKLIYAYYGGDNGWRDLIKAHRLALAEQRKENSKFGGILENLQICDKKEIVSKTPNLIKKLGFSKSLFTSRMESFEKIRNNIAHSHDKISSDFSEIINLILISTKIIELSEGWVD
jgi:hypothetical protein